MICKNWQWKGVEGDYSSQLCTTSPVKTRAWRRSFIHYAGTEYIHASLKIFRLELLLFWKTYDVQYDRIMTAFRIYWRGKKLVGLDHRHY